MTLSSGITMRLLPITTFTFTGLGTAKTIIVPIAQHLDCTTFTEAHFLWRWHAGTTVAAGSLVAGAYADGWDFEDPTTSFLSASPLASATQNATPAAPVLSVIAVGLAAGATLGYARHLALLLTANQTTANSGLIAVVSCDLVLKGGDGGGSMGGPNSYMGYRVM